MNVAKKDLDRKISLFLPALCGGGAERVFINLAKGFAKRGFHVDFVLAQKEGSYVDEIPNFPELIHVLELNQKQKKTFRTIKSFPSIIKYLKKEQPEILISGLHANIPVLFAKKISKVNTRVIITEHNTFSFQNKLLPKPYKILNLFLTRLIYPYADRILAVSNGVADDLMNVTGLKNEKLMTIYNPIITNEIINKAVSHLDHPWFYPDEPPVIISIGRLSEQKNFKILIRAFAKVCKYKSARLMILGEGEERKELEELIRQLNLEDVVCLPGFVSNPYPYLIRSRLFVLSSNWEGLPTVLVEALYCNTPIIATDCHSGPREILQDGKFGTLVPINDENELANEIISELDKKKENIPIESWQPFFEDTVIDQYLKLIFSEK